MAAMQVGVPVVIGVHKTISDLVVFPHGKIKIRMRPGCAVRVYVRTDNGILDYAIKNVDGKWLPVFLVGRNYRTEQ